MPIVRINRRIAVAIVSLVLWARFARADDTDISPPGTPAAVDETHPVYSTDARWVARFLVGVGGLFLAALIVGRVVRTESVDQEEQTENPL